MKVPSLLKSSITTLALCGTAFSQGADLCVNAQAIAGLGTFNFDNTTATTDGLSDPLCLEFGNDTIELDVWFAWTAPNTGTFVMSTCGMTSVDTKIGVYDGSCAGAVLACNDDTCALQSEVSWQAIGGQVYTLRLGSYPINPVGGTGSFVVTEDAPVLNPANGHYYQILDAPGISWPQAMTSAAAMTYMGAQGHLATITDQVENDFIFSLGDAHYRYIGGFQNLSSSSYAEPSGGWEWITGEPWAYSNWWLPNEPNNSGPSGAEDYLELLDSGQFPQSWNDTQNDHSHGYVVEFEVNNAPPGAAYCFGDGTGGICPCSGFGGLGEGCANTSGMGASMVASGSASIGNDTFRLDITGAPGAKPGLILRGDNMVAAPVGDGILCSAGNSQRSHIQLTVAGDTSFTNFNGAPFGSVANMGSPTNFQFWYRDPQNVCGGGFNFTNGWTVDYQP